MRARNALRHAQRLKGACAQHTKAARTHHGNVVGSAADTVAAREQRDPARDLVHPVVEHVCRHDDEHPRSLVLTAHCDVQHREHHRLHRESAWVSASQRESARVCAARRTKHRTSIQCLPRHAMSSYSARPKHPTAQRAMLGSAA
jgi:hypothetical protein